YSAHFVQKKVEVFLISKRKRTARAGPPREGLAKSLPFGTIPLSSRPPHPHGGGIMADVQAARSKPTSRPSPAPPVLPNPHVGRWVAECIDLCRPAQVCVLDGSPQEKRDIIRQAV